MIYYAVQGNMDAGLVKETCRALDQSGQSYFKFDLTDGVPKHAGWTFTDDIVVPFGAPELLTAQLPKNWKLFYAADRFEHKKYLGGSSWHFDDRDVARVTYRLAVVRNQVKGGCKLTEYEKEKIERLLPEELTNLTSYVEIVADAYVPSYTYVIDIAELVNGHLRILKYHPMNVADLVAIDREVVFQAITDSELFLQRYFKATAKREFD